MSVLTKRRTVAVRSNGSRRRSSSSGSIRSRCPRSRRRHGRRSRDDGRMTPVRHRRLLDAKSVKSTGSRSRRRRSVDLSQDYSASRVVSVALSVDRSANDDPVGPSRGHRAFVEMTVSGMERVAVPHAIRSKHASRTLPLPILLQLFKILLRMRPHLNRGAGLDVFRHLFPLFSVEFQSGEEELVFFLGPATGVFRPGFDEFSGGGGGGRDGREGVGGGGCGEVGFGVLVEAVQLDLRLRLQLRLRLGLRLRLRWRSQRRKMNRVVVVVGIVIEARSVFASISAVVMNRSFLVGSRIHGTIRGLRLHPHRMGRFRSGIGMRRREFDLIVRQGQEVFVSQIRVLRGFAVRRMRGVVRRRWDFGVNRGMGRKRRGVQLARVLDDGKGGDRGGIVVHVENGQGHGPPKGDLLGVESVLDADARPVQGVQSRVGDSGDVPIAFAFVEVEPPIPPVPARNDDLPLHGPLWKVVVQLEVDGTLGREGQLILVEGAEGRRGGIIVSVTQLHLVDHVLHDGVEEDGADDAVGGVVSLVDAVVVADVVVDAKV
mmetsp:Transcript_17151/g.35802  ORF Transcript_17151/g.35802 Transcript_17151/m.35802 type:complete len:544 (+) Transcript_17151:618-2249(+)